MSTEVVFRGTGYRLNALTGIDRILTKYTQSPASGSRVCLNALTGIDRILTV